eukprot:CAMPEP_0179095004 /NCGR_PEP_ID=MMETSP0796-20121207/43599_1 /TAXON_ID=73915 /ORGANISM="Pyrodinium bahamense, Strain pbaha01" /LENGTH=355 /DNA_ID=CAMNT_0020792687 /DNA_START=84 /DNA_END=1147 /DNA_ORIENTATION=-
MGEVLPDKDEVEDSEIFFTHVEPRLPVLFGAAMVGERAPVSFASVMASEELTRYLRDDPQGPFSEPLDSWPPWMFTGRPWLSPGACSPETDGRWKSWGFGFSPKEPFLLKADWHCVDAWGHVRDLFVPRMDMAAPVRCAPPRILAFMEAFRRVNAACWAGIAEALVQLGVETSGRKKPCEGLAQIFLNAISRQELFGVIEAQAGPGSSFHNMRVHRDGATSLLHLGLTLSGHRKLHSKLASTPSGGVLPGTQGGWMEADMSPGSAYISSPFLFEHAVQYEQDISDGPVIALMCRFAFTQQEAACVNHLRDRRMVRVARAVAEGLSASVSRRELRLPSLQEVMNMENMTVTQRAVP